MATIDDIDTKSAVNRFLQRQVVTPQTNEQAETGEEVQAVLESVATSFLLFPQSALPIILRGRNSLRQVVQADLNVINFIIKAVSEVRNPDLEVTDTSDLIEAQTALLELDRIGRVDEGLVAFGRYKDAINRFLDDQLAFTLKRQGLKEFERSGSEARQDIFSILPQFGAAHNVMITRLEQLQNSVSDFRSVNLTSIVSTLTINKVRKSLTRVKDRTEARTISQTTSALELLSGSASLESISSNTDIFDPTVQTGTFPPRRTLQLRPPPTAAVAESPSGPWTLSGSSWFFKGTMDPLGPSPQTFDFELPGPGASDRVYVSSEFSLPTIPTDGTLYLYLEGAATPDIEVPITNGSPSLATIVSDIDTALGADGSCIEKPGATGIIIFGSASITSIVVKADSISAGTTGVYNSDPSVHEELGFIPNQTSLPKGQFTAESLAFSIQNRIPGGAVLYTGSSVRITSNSQELRESSIEFDTSPGLGTPVQNQFGFIGSYEALPPYVELVEGGVALVPGDEGVFIGSVVTASESQISGSPVRSLNGEAISNIDGTQIFFSSSIPREDLLSTTITSPIVAGVQNIIQGLSPFVGAFGSDFTDLQQVMSPILSNPTTAQINDARRVLNRIRTDLVDLLSALDSVQIREDRTQFTDISNKILNSLEERGLDRAQELVTTCRFSEFFSLNKNNASRSSRLLQSMEDLMQNDIPISTNEEDIEDGPRVEGSNPADPLEDAEIDGDALTFSE